MRPATIHKITKLVGRPHRDCVYDIIGYLDLNLCVDVGAAAGDVTRRLRQLGGRNTRVVAFEPFPGNHGFFYESIRELNNVELVKKAVTNRSGRASFSVPSVVQGTEQGWETRAGYSSVGFLSDGGSPGAGVGKSLRRAGRQILDKMLKPPLCQTLVVDTTSIDQEFAGTKIDFMKVDVQGGEAQVLHGAASMLEARQIDILYLEWSGDPAVVQLLSESNYWMCDSTYVAGRTAAVGARSDVAHLEDIGFRIVDELKLSTGGVAYELLLVRDDVSPSDAMTRARALGLPWIQTDLIAVSDQCVARFKTAVQQYSGRQAASGFDADV